MGIVSYSELEKQAEGLETVLSKTLYKVIYLSASGKGWSAETELYKNKRNAETAAKRYNGGVVVTYLQAEARR